MRDGSLFAPQASHGDKTLSPGGGYAYRASKAALNIISTAQAHDLRPHGIKTMLLHPGYVATEMNGVSLAPPTDRSHSEIALFLGNAGWISIEESSKGIVSLLERSDDDLHGRFFSYDGLEIPW